MIFCDVGLHLSAPSIICATPAPILLKLFEAAQNSLPIDHASYQTCTAYPVSIQIKKTWTCVLVMIYLPGASSLIMLGMLRVGSAYPDIAWKPSGNGLGIGAAPERYGRESRMCGGYGA